MKTLVGVVVLLFAQALVPSQASIPYFSKVRDVGVASPDRQNYVVVDGELWMNARADLADLRLYSGSNEVPYALQVQQGRVANDEAKAAIINLGRSGSAVQFVVETGIDAEYDRIRLQLSEDARNFVTRATVEGSDDLHSGRWVALGTYPLFDFSKEKLGANLTIAIPASRFSFLRITVPELQPQQVAGAAVAMTAREEARWSDLATVDVSTKQEPGKTVVEWSELTKAPVERLRFAVDPGQTNFRRHVAIYEIERSEETQRVSELLITEADIGRIHVERQGKVVDSEDLDVDLNRTAKIFRVVIDNGDDAPLRLQAIQPLAHERRVYFDPRSAGGQLQGLRLYYGDEELGPPVYDFSKLFRADSNAVGATLGPGQANPAYTGRPDRRPWTERHGWVLWAALVIAVLGLGAVALRGLRRTAAS